MKIFLHRFFVGATLHYSIMLHRWLLCYESANKEVLCFSFFIKHFIKSFQ